MSNSDETKLFSITGDDNNFYYLHATLSESKNISMLNLRVTREVFGSASLVQGAIADDGVGGDGGRDAGDQQE